MTDCAPIDIDAQDGAQGGFDVLPIANGAVRWGIVGQAVMGAAAITQGEVEVAIGSEGDVPGVVVELGFVYGEKYDL